MARVYSSTSVATTLASAITNIGTSMTVASGTGAALIQGSGFTNGDTFTIAIDVDTQNEEICYVTYNSGDTFTITRAQAGTSGIAHASGSSVKHVLTSADLDYFRNGVNTANAAIPASTLTTKGDLLSRTSATLQRLPVGSNGQVLVADSTATLGLNWATAATGSVTNIVTGTGLTGGPITTTGTLAIDSTVTTLTGTQTLTNKTLTDPVITESVNAQTGTTYTTVLTDAKQLVTLNNASAITVTIPPNSSVAYAVGSKIDFIQKGAGQVSFAQGSGVTIRSTGATATAPKLRVQYSAATAWYEGSDVWYVVGDIA